MYSPWQLAVATRRGNSPWRRSMATLCFPRGPPALYEYSRGVLPGLPEASERLGAGKLDDCLPHHAVGGEDLIQRRGGLFTQGPELCYLGRPMHSSVIPHHLLFSVCVCLCVCVCVCLCVCQGARYVSVNVGAFCRLVGDREIDIMQSTCTKSNSSIHSSSFCCFFLVLYCHQPSLCLLI